VGYCAKNFRDGEKNKCFKKPRVLHFQISHSSSGQLDNTLLITLNARLVIGIGNHAFNMNALLVAVSRNAGQLRGGKFSLVNERANS
jgi:hypothetical protein